MQFALLEARAATFVAVPSKWVSSVFAHLITFFIATTGTNMNIGITEVGRSLGFRAGCQRRAGDSLRRSKAQHGDGDEGKAEPTESS